MTITPSHQRQNYWMLATAAPAFEITGEIVLAALAAIGVIGIILGTITWHAYKAFQKLTTQDNRDTKKLQQEERERSERNSREDTQLREQLLTRYKEMYELEKQRADQDITEVRRQLTNLHAQQHEITTRYDILLADHEKLQGEYHKVVALNVEYQNARTRDQAELQQLRQDVATLRRQLDTLDPSKPNPV